MSIERPKVSIVVRTENDIELIDNSLNMIKSQTYSNYEVLVCDLNSTDGTRKELEKYHYARVYSFDPCKYTNGKILNYAVRKSLGEIVVFYDLACRPDQDTWLEELISPILHSNEYIGTFGQLRSRESSSEFLSLERYRQFSLRAASIKKKYIVEHPFDTKITNSEDLEWCFRVEQKGYKLKYIHKAIVFESSLHSFKDLAKKSYGVGWAKSKITEKKSNIIGGLFVPTIIELALELIYMLVHIEFKSSFKRLTYRFIQATSAYKGSREFFK